MQAHEGAGGGAAAQLALLAHEQLLAPPRPPVQMPLFPSAVQPEAAIADRPRSPRQIEMKRTRRPRSGPPLAPWAALPPGWVVLVCVLVPEPRRRRPKDRPRLRRIEDDGQPGALNVAGPRLRVAGVRYAAHHLIKVEATAKRAAYWRATGGCYELPADFPLPAAKEDS